MAVSDMFRKSVDGIAWQDYRASNTGMLVYYTSESVCEIPIREVPEDSSVQYDPDPHYESGTFGFYGCTRNKIRASFVKSKIRYMFFMTKYAGQKEAYQDKLLVTGFFRITKTSEVQKYHLRYLTEYTCMDSDSCIALRADEVHLVAVEDAFEITDDVLKSWGYAAKMTRQSKVVLPDEPCNQLLFYLRSKQNKREEYIAETRRLLPHEMVLEESEEGEEVTVEQ